MRNSHKPRCRYTAEQIRYAMAQAEAEVRVPAVLRENGVSPATFYRSRCGVWMNESPGRAHYRGSG
jgi:hypothetical protein